MSKGMPRGTRRVRPWEFEALGIYGQNQYRFLPVRRESNVGNINEALRLTTTSTVKKDGLPNRIWGLRCEYKTENHRIRWITSAFQTAESETFDILGILA